ncbi:hypothetical protein P8452_30663 [Trifolium repens]|nr:hypothetical protein P8452_30663 [Trifolium repens]
MDTISTIPVSFPNSVKTLNGTNYEDWKDSLDLYLALHDFDLALRVDKPADLTNESTEAQRTFYEKWEASNRKCLKVISYTMEKSIRKSIPETENAKDYLKAVSEKFTKFDKAKKCEYLSLFDKTKYDEEESFKRSKEQSVQFVAGSTSGTKDFKGNNHKGKHYDKKKGKALQIYEPKKKSFKVKFKGNCKYCKKFGHKVDDCYALKKKLEKQGVHKPEETK